MAARGAMFGWRLADDSLREWHERGIGGYIVVRLGRVRYAPRSLLGSREGTDDGDASGARNGRASIARNGSASVARSAKFGLAFAVLVSETEPDPDWLSTGINASLNRARTQRDVERRERSAGTASLRASSRRPTSWRTAPRCLIRLQPIWSPFRTLVLALPAPPKCTVPDGEYCARSATHR
jgi:hypothetical protein